MPWKPSDARRHTKKANTAKKRRQFAHVANSVLRRTGDEGRAVRAGNAAVAGTVRHKGRQKAKKRSGSRKRRSYGRR
jgi:hypothetical protein